MTNATPRPLWVCLHNDALAGLVGSQAAQRCLAEVDRPPAERQVIFSYAFTSFLNLLLGITPETLDSTRHILVLADRLCGPGRGAYLPPPPLHLRLWIDGLDNHDKSTSEIVLLDSLIQGVIAAPRWDDFLNQYGEMQDNLTRSLRRHHEQLAMFVGYRRDAILKQPDARTRFSANVTPESLLRSHREEILTMFDLNAYYGQRSEEEILHGSPGMYYYLELERAYLDRYYFESIEPQPDDFFSKQLGVYLDGCDYLVTSDREYRNLFGRYDLDTLTGRAIAPDELTAHLEEPYLIRRVAG